VSRGCSCLAAAAVCLLAASPAAARGKEKQAPLPAPGLVLNRIAPLPPENRNERSEPARIRFSNESIIRQDGSPGSRHSIVGSWPLVGPVAAEVGLFSVAGAMPKERELKRSDPLADVAPRRSRVAAVGLRMSF
jgi:hypothetical protein